MEGTGYMTEKKIGNCEGYFCGQHIHCTDDSGSTNL